MTTRLPRLTLGHSSVQRVRVSLRQAVHQACVPLTELDARLARARHVRRALQPADVNDGECTAQLQLAHRRSD